MNGIFSSYLLHLRNEIIMSEYGDEGNPWFWILVVIMTVGLLFIMVYHVSLAGYAVWLLGATCPVLCIICIKPILLSFFFPKHTVETLKLWLALALSV